MEEHKKDEQRADIFHGQHKQMDKAYVGGSPVGDFIMHHLGRQQFAVNQSRNSNSGIPKSEHQSHIPNEREQIPPMMTA